jgi:hypothetical protein
VIERRVKRGGGGMSQGAGLGHVPRGDTPKWTCCGNEILYPGCLAAGDPEPEGFFGSYRKYRNPEYKQKIQEWASQNQKLIWREKQVHVRDGEVVHWERVDPNDVIEKVEDESW